MLFSSWALSGDSLIVAIALSAQVPPRHIIPLILLFGICDAAASAIGPSLGFQPQVPSLLVPMFLLLWGGLIMFNRPLIALCCRSVPWAYMLPPLLAVDNLVGPSNTPTAAGVVSSAAAALGFALGFAMLRGLGSRPLRHRIIGASLAAAGLLLAL